MAHRRHRRHPPGGGSFFTASQISEQIEDGSYDPRTIQRDIEFMRDSLNAPIESGRQGYRYTEPNFFIKSIPLSEGEAFAITVMNPLLEQYRNTPLEKQLRSVFSKIASCLPDRISVDTSFLNPRITFIPSGSAPTRSRSLCAGSWGRGTRSKSSRRQSSWRRSAPRPRRSPRCTGREKVMPEAYTVTASASGASFCSVSAHDFSDIFPIHDTRCHRWGGRINSKDMSSLNWAIGGKMLIVIVLGLLGISIYGKFSGKASPGMKKISTQALKYIYYVFSIVASYTQKLWIG